MMRPRLEAMVNPAQQEDLDLVSCMLDGTWTVHSLRLCFLLLVYGEKTNPEVKTCQDIMHKIF